MQSLTRPAARMNHIDDLVLNLFDLARTAISQSFIAGPQEEAQIARQLSAAIHATRDVGETIQQTVPIQLPRSRPGYLLVGVDFYMVKTKYAHCSLGCST
jgi:hypothetical protein